MQAAAVFVLVHIASVLAEFREGDVVPMSYMSKFTGASAEVSCKVLSSLLCCVQTLPYPLRITAVLVEEVTHDAAWRRDKSRVSSVSG